MNVMTMFSPLKHLKGKDRLLNGFSIKGTVTHSYCYGWNKYPQPAVNNILTVIASKFGSEYNFQ